MKELNPALEVPIDVDHVFTITEAGRSQHGITAVFFVRKGKEALTTPTRIKLADHASCEAAVERWASLNGLQRGVFAQALATASIQLEGLLRKKRKHFSAAGDFPLTDTGNAELFAARHGAAVRFDHGRGDWFVFNGQHWELDRTAKVDGLALEAVRHRQAESVRVEDSDLRTRSIRWALESESRGKRESLVKLAGKLPSLAVTGDDWDTDPWLLGVQNGVVDLRTGELRQGRPVDSITKVAPGSFDPTATCSRWERFLAEIFADHEDLPGYLQRVLGYSLTGITEEQVFWILWGEGANGKSTLIETFMQFVLSDAYSWVMPFPAATWSNNMSEYQKASLAGQRFVTASEVTRRGYLNEELIKSLTGGDTINARHPYGRPFKFVPAAKIFLRVNHKPIIKDQSHGMWRRVKLVPFTQKFSNNTSLKDELRAEAAGILAWAVRGCLAWQRDGLLHPACVDAATAAYQQESNPLADFFEERCALGSDVRTRAQHAFEEYVRWCVARQVPDGDRLSQRTFGQQIAADPRFTVEDGKGRDRSRYYVGLGLQERSGQQDMEAEV